MSKKVEVYTWRVCPFCIKVKELLDREGVTFTEYDIQGDREKMAALTDRTGSGTVPQVFVDGCFYGGCDDIHALYSQGRFEEVFK